MAKLSSIFTHASVSEMRESTWTPVPKSQLRFNAKDIESITKCNAMHCNGENGNYVAIKVQVASKRKEYWFTADFASAKVLDHMQELDPKKLVVYLLTDGEKTIARMRVL